MAVFASAHRRHADVDVLLAEWGPREHRRTAFGGLSGGQRQRLFIALALLGDPEVVVLDELTTGLDPAARRDPWVLVRSLRERGVTVLLVTHAMDEAEMLCDRLVVIDRGRVVATGTPDACAASTAAWSPPTWPSRGRGPLMRALATLTRVEASLPLREPTAIAFTLLLPMVLLVRGGYGGNTPGPAVRRRRDRRRRDRRRHGARLRRVRDGDLGADGSAGDPCRLPRPRRPAPHAGQPAAAGGVDGRGRRRGGARYPRRSDARRRTCRRAGLPMESS